MLVTIFFCCTEEAKLRGDPTAAPSVTPKLTRFCMLLSACAYWRCTGVYMRFSLVSKCVFYQLQKAAIGAFTIGSKRYINNVPFCRPTRFHQAAKMKCMYITCLCWRLCFYFYLSVNIYILNHLNKTLNTVLCSTLSGSFCVPLLFRKGTYCFNSIQFFFFFFYCFFLKLFLYFPLRPSCRHFQASSSSSFCL